MADKEWKIKASVKNEYITITCQTTYFKEKKRTVSEISFPESAASDIIKAIKELKDK